jgi:hypothetical protein
MTVGKQLSDFGMSPGAGKVLLIALLTLMLKLLLILTLLLILLLTLLLILLLLLMLLLMLLLTLFPILPLILLLILLPTLSLVLVIGIMYIISDFGMSPGGGKVMLKGLKGLKRPLTLNEYVRLLHIENLEICYGTQKLSTQILIWNT